MGKFKKYEVEKAVQLRYNKDTKEKEYLIKWDNYSMAESTWEPIDNLKKDCPSMLKEYMFRLDQHKSQCLSRHNENYKSQKGDWIYYSRFDLKGRTLGQSELKRLEKEERKQKTRDYKESAQKRKKEDWDLLSIEKGDSSEEASDSSENEESVQEVKPFVSTTKSKPYLYKGRAGQEEVRREGCRDRETPRDSGGPAGEEWRHDLHSAL